MSKIMYQKTSIITFLFFNIFLKFSNGTAVNYAAAQPCDSAACKLPDCHCSASTIPLGLNVAKIPQLVTFTFDDDVNVLNYQYYSQAFFDRVNPDGCPVGATYFMSHEYTDYSKVHELHAHGHEIALHSITHYAQTSYWSTITEDQLRQEFYDLRNLTAHFANISINDMKGIRLPFLQLSGDTSFQFLKDFGLEYDCSWPTQKINPGLWPYTLDYASIQDCPIQPCPTSSIPGVWVAPMLDWVDNAGYVCSFVDACTNIPTDETELLNFLIENFNRQYNGNRAPFGFYLHSAWFDTVSSHFPAYVRFIDYLQQLEDVYIVSVGRALEWVRNPNTLDNLSNTWPQCQPTYTSTCNPISCEMMKGQEYRYADVCTASCPAVYPWLGNPWGEVQ